MARRPLGIAGIQKKDQLNAAFKKQGELLTEAKLEHVQKSLETFRGHLEVFARKHKNAIQKDPKFRAQFAQMCAQIGVDPLASNKGFWAELLGVGDYYFDLGVKILTIAISTRSTNGGIMGIDELFDRLKAQRERAARAVAKTGRGADLKLDKGAEISEDDVAKAIDKLSALGNGLKVANIGGRKALISVPLEFSHDQTLLLEFAASLKGSPVSVKKIQAQLGWDADRAKRACTEMAAEVFAWYDAHSEEYWFPAFIEGGVRFEV